MQIGIDEYDCPESKDILKELAKYRDQRTYSQSVSPFLMLAFDRPYLEISAKQCISCICNQTSRLDFVKIILSSDSAKELTFQMLETIRTIAKRMVDVTALDSTLQTGNKLPASPDKWKIFKSFLGQLVFKRGNFNKRTKKSRVEIYEEVLKPLLIAYVQIKELTSLKKPVSLETNFKVFEHIEAAEDPRIYGQIYEALNTANEADRLDQNSRWEQHNACDRAFRQLLRQFEHPEMEPFLIKLGASTDEMKQWLKALNEGIYYKDLPSRYQFIFHARYRIYRLLQYSTNSKGHASCHVSLHGIPIKPNVISEDGANLLVSMDVAQAIVSKIQKRIRITLMQQIGEDFDTDNETTTEGVFKVIISFRHTINELQKAADKAKSETKWKILDLVKKTTQEIAKKIIGGDAFDSVKSTLTQKDLSFVDKLSQIGGIAIDYTTKTVTLPKLFDGLAFGLDQVSQYGPLVCALYKASKDKTLEESIRIFNDLEPLWQIQDQIETCLHTEKDMSAIRIKLQEPGEDNSAIHAEPYFIPQ